MRWELILINLPVIIQGLIILIKEISKAMKDHKDFQELDGEQKREVVRNSVLDVANRLPRTPKDSEINLAIELVVNEEKGHLTLV